MNQTVEVKTSELTGAALDWAVAKAEGLEVSSIQLGARVWVGGLMPAGVMPDASRWSPSTDWAQGGPLIERERIATVMVDDAEPVLWRGQLSDPFRALPSVQSHIGPTPLIAAMRCLVASKLGDTVQVPAELI